jgi:hypothetical protein
MAQNTLGETHLEHIQCHKYRLSSTIVWNYDNYLALHDASFAATSPFRIPTPSIRQSSTSFGIAKNSQKKWLIPRSYPYRPQSDEKFTSSQDSHEHVH